jgi:hypothetical protein
MDEQGHVRLGLDEAEGDQVGDEVNVPSPQYLLESVQRAIQPIDLVRASGFNEASGLATLDRLDQSAMEKDIFDI